MSQQPNQLAIALDPTQWSEFKFHPRVSEVFQNWVRNNQYPYSVLLSGHTGTGKTTAAKLLIKSALCPNRPDNSGEPCGACQTCKADPRTMSSVNNVTWIQRGQEETLATQFKRALQEAGSPAYGLGDRKFIVFDELQSIPRDRLQDLLFYPELADVLDRNRVTFIFLTMAEDKIDSGLLKPLKDRSRYFRFRKLQDEEVYTFLAQHYPQAPSESLQIISHNADGSLRSALASMQDCLEQDESLSPLSVAEILYYVSQTDRLRLWQALSEYDYRFITDFWKENAYKFDELKLAHQMLRDLDQAMYKQPTADQLLAFRLIYQFIHSPAKVRVLDMIKTLVGLDLIPIEPALNPLEQSGYQRLKSVLA